MRRSSLGLVALFTLCTVSGCKSVRLPADPTVAFFPLKPNMMWVYWVHSKSQQREYVITDTKSGEKVTFPGPDKLDTYVNHTVQLTGKMMNRSGEKAFQPETVKMVSASCESPQKR